MPTKTFYLDQQATEPITINWGYNWKNLTVTKDGDLVGQIQDSKQLKEGRSFELADGRLFSLKLIQRFGFMPILELLLDGKPVQGSGTEPNQQVKQVYQVLLILAIFNAVLGVIAELATIDFLTALGLGYGTLVVGAIYGLLAYFIKFKLSVTALYIAIIFMVLDMVLTFVFAAELGTNPTSGLIMKIIFTLILVKGIPGLKQLKREAADNIAYLDQSEDLTS